MRAGGGGGGDPAGGSPAWPGGEGWACDWAGPFAACSWPGVVAADCGPLAGSADGAAVGECWGLPAPEAATPLRDLDWAVETPLRDLDWAAETPEGGQLAVAAAPPGA